jgi:ABC-type uncharacterized transport system ATPase subunit
MSTQGKKVKKINLKKVILDVDGVEVRKFDIVRDAKNVPLFIRDGEFLVAKTKDNGVKTVRDVIIESLNKVFKDEEPTPELLIDRGELIRKIKTADEVEVSEKEIELIKKVISKGTIDPDAFMQIYDEIF